MTHPPRPSGGAAFAYLSLIVGLLGLVVALLLPFAPVVTNDTTVTWPQRGQQPESTTAFFVPYAPADTQVDVPCSVVRAGQQSGQSTTLVSSHLPGKPTRGFAVTTADRDLLVLVGGRQVYRGPVPNGDCSVGLRSDAAGSSVQVGNRSVQLTNDRVREVFAFTTDLSPQQASGLQVRAHTSNWFESSPTSAKCTLVAAQLVLVISALVLLGVADRRRRRGSARRAHHFWSFVRTGWSLRGVDLATLATLGVWALLGPRTPDDSFTDGIVRNALRTGAFTNYYRWENSAEAPFTLALHLLEPLVSLHAGPLMLRVPSVLAGFLTWLLLGRGILPRILPGRARAIGMYGLAAASLLAWWLPFDLGVRPEPFVALGTTAVLAFLLRAVTREGDAGLLWLGLAALVTGLTVAVNPIGIVAAAPFGLLAGDVWRVLRGPRCAGGSRVAPAGHLATTACAAAVGLIAMFADQSWYGVARATRLHRFYGPNVPWFEEIRRYENLLGFDEQGGMGRRLPVLITIAVVLCAVLLLARGARRLPGMRRAHLAPGVLAVALGLLWLTPSKWSHYFGALAGFGAAALTTAVVLFWIAARRWYQQRPVLIISAAGTVTGIAAVCLAFAGKNTWFLYSHFGVPHDDGPFRPLNQPWPWLLLVGALLVGTRLLLGRPAGQRMLVRTPAILAAGTAGLTLAVLVASFAIAPAQQAGSYSVGGQNIAALTGTTCGLGDRVVTTTDAPNGVLAPADASTELTGFVPRSGYPDDSPPPEQPGIGQATHLWGSSRDGPLSTGTLTSQWFSLPRLDRNQELAVTVAGRTGDGNRLTLEFGTKDGDTTRPLRTHTLDDAYRDSDERPQYPSDHVVQDKPQNNPDWRTLHVDPSDIPAGATVVRIRAADNTTDAGGWLATTGPRIRDVRPLRQLVQQQREPTYVDWSMLWSTPCVGNTPRVAHGMVQAPTMLLIPPDDLGFDGEAAFVKDIGGAFTGVDEIGQRETVPTRLLGTEDKPEYADWGEAVRVTYPVRRDAYDTHTTDITRWGWQGDRTPLGYPPAPS